MSTNKRLRILSLVVIIYMLLGFSWWSILLFIKNRDAFHAKVELARIAMIAEGRVTDEESFLATPEYEYLQREYVRQEWMIAGEALVFVITLMIGVWLINRGYHKEVMAAQQRRNFLLSITHELKSPIASIRLVLETLLRRNLPPDKQIKLNHSAQTELERLNKLVNDLLLSAKLEATYQPHFEEVNLSNLANELLDKLEAKHPEAHFSIRESQDTLILHRGDLLGLTSLILNLLENAVKYSDSPATIEIRLKKENNTLVLEVADNGIGIDEKEKPRIFQKFYRVGSEDTRKTKGTGLGLYIVEQIVKAHGGTIKVSDNIPSGTVFSIRLPNPKPTTEKNKLGHENSIG